MKNNIKPIPTYLNYFNIIHQRTTALKKQGNTSRLLIIALIIWNITLTVSAMNMIVNKQVIPHFEEDTPINLETIII